MTEVDILFRQTVQQCEQDPMLYVDALIERVKPIKKPHVLWLGSQLGLDIARFHRNVKSATSYVPRFNFRLLDSSDVRTQWQARVENARRENLGEFASNIATPIYGFAYDAIVLDTRGDAYNLSVSAEALTDNLEHLVSDGALCVVYPDKSRWFKPGMSF